MYTSQLQCAVKACERDDDEGATAGRWGEIRLPMPIILATPEMKDPRRVRLLIDSGAAGSVCGENFAPEVKVRRHRAGPSTHLRAYETKADLVCRLLLE